MTNLLNEVISYKQVNLHGENFLVNDIKEQLGFVSTDFQLDMDVCQQKVNPIDKEYVLPDYKTTKKGFVRDPVIVQKPEED